MKFRFNYQKRETRLSVDVCPSLVIPNKNIAECDFDIVLDCHEPVKFSVFSCVSHVFFQLERVFSMV